MTTLKTAVKQTSHLEALLSNKGLRYSASFREKKYNHAIPLLNIINPLFLFSFFFFFFFFLSTPSSSTSLVALVEDFGLNVLTRAAEFG